MLHIVSIDISQTQSKHVNKIKYFFIVLYAFLHVHVLIHHYKQS